MLRRNSKKSSHPPSDRPRAQTRLEIVHADVWGKQSVESYSGCQSAVMFTDDHSRMRLGVPTKTKYATAEGLHALVQEVANSAGLCIGKIHCDGGAEFKGRFQELCVSLGIIIETNAPSIPEGTPSLSVVLAPSWVLRAASSWGHLTCRADCGLKLLKPRSTQRPARPRTFWTERYHWRYG